MRKISGFTIVELLVVITVISILAVITFASYIGVAQRAKEASLKSDLTNSSKQIKIFQATEVDGNYPTANNCPTPGTTEICLRSSSGNAYTYTSNNTVSPKTFTLIATNGPTIYQITDNTAPSAVVLNPADWLTIGTQTWAKANLNVGTMVTSATQQTQNSILEKYCFQNLESNCDLYGGLYRWDEAMQYVTNAGAQGICPVGSHVPTEVEWKTLEMQLGMTQAQADSTGWRGTDQGFQLKTDGTSGLNMPFNDSGGLDVNEQFLAGIMSGSYFWSSSESGVNAWSRRLRTMHPQIALSTMPKTYSFSVRCLGN